jgi:hypothetical protein
MRIVETALELASFFYSPDWEFLGGPRQRREGLLGIRHQPGSKNNAWQKCLRGLDTKFA